jgi:hypothetical protein
MRAPRNSSRPSSPERERVEEDAHPFLVPRPHRPTVKRVGHGGIDAADRQGLRRAAFISRRLARLVLGTRPWSETVVHLAPETGLKRTTDAPSRRSVPESSGSQFDTVVGSPNSSSRLRSPAPSSRGPTGSSSTRRLRPWTRRPRRASIAWCASGFRQPPCSAWATAERFAHFIPASSRSGRTQADRPRS